MNTHDKIKKKKRFLGKGIVEIMNIPVCSSDWIRLSKHRKQYVEM